MCLLINNLNIVGVAPYAKCGVRLYWQKATDPDIYFKATSHNYLPGNKNMKTVNRYIKTVFGGSGLLCLGRFDWWIRIIFWDNVLQPAPWVLSRELVVGVMGPGSAHRTEWPRGTMWQVNWQLPCCLEFHLPSLREVIKDVWAQVWHLTSSHNKHFQN